ncbi:MAG: ATP-binding protein [Anaerolineaceae bacterium]|jgi:predicted AAA+ superfamily ATPase|nr:ATP-binding protein [Anaerolineaceae bacterium]
MFKTRFYSQLENYFSPGKVLIIYGPRRTGKTTLVKYFLAKTSLKYLFISGDDIQMQHLLSSKDVQKILELVENYQLLVIDEAQQIPEVGSGLKILVDHKPDLQIIATGSSSFELSGQIGEPLTGRKRTLTLFPFAQCELSSQFNNYELKQKLENYLVFGTYPEVVIAETTKQKTQILQELVNSYLLKDILAFDRIRNSRSLLNLLQLLAFQITSEVSYNELANKLSISINTVQRYLDLLEKTFVIFRLGGFSRNLRNEVTKTAKYYFFDNGIRNAIIQQHKPLALRNDQGQLWENFMMVERLKYRSYQEIYANMYFWRTYQSGEIDLIEDREGILHGYEIKWSENKDKITPPALWFDTYKNSTFTFITPKNYLEFVTTQ